MVCGARNLKKIVHDTPTKSLRRFRRSPLNSAVSTKSSKQGEKQKLVPAFTSLIYRHFFSRAFHCLPDHTAESRPSPLRTIDTKSTTPTGHSPLWNPFHNIFSPKWLFISSLVRVAERVKSFFFEAAGRWGKDKWQNCEVNGIRIFDSKQEWEGFTKKRIQSRFRCTSITCSLNNVLFTRAYVFLNLSFLGFQAATETLLLNMLKCNLKT